MPMKKGTTMKTFFTEKKQELFVGDGRAHLSQRYQCWGPPDLLEILDGEPAGSVPTLYFFVPDPTAPEGLREASLAAGPDGWTQEQVKAAWEAAADTLPALYQRRNVFLSRYDGAADHWCQDYFELLSNLEDWQPDHLTLVACNGTYATTWGKLSEDPEQFTQGMPTPADEDGYVRFRFPACDEMFPQSKPVPPYC